jgi:hypothetical protein
MPLSDDELLNLYTNQQQLNANAVVDKPMSDDDLVNLYTKPTNHPTNDYVDPVTGKTRIVIRPHPPISGVSPEEEQKIQSTEEATTPNTNPSTSLGGDIKNTITSLPTTFGSNVAQSYKGSIDLATGGIKDISNNLPVTGLAKLGLGTVGAIASPISGTIKTLVEDPITQLTGDPEVGSRAGLVAGSALPIGTIASKIKSTLPTNKAINNIVDAIGQENLPDVINKLESNPRLSVMDVSPTVRQMGQKLVVTEGPQQNQLTQFVQQRQATAKDAVTGAYNTAMGQPVSVVDRLNQIKQDAAAVGQQQIQPAIQGAKPVDLDDTIKYIDSKLKLPNVNTPINKSVLTPEFGDYLPNPASVNRLTNIRDLLTNDKIQRAGPSELHIIQSKLRSEGEKLLSSTDGGSKLLGNAIMNVRNKIVDAIDTASGGKYKPALKNFRDEMQIEDAFNRGTNIFRNRPTEFEDRPEFWQNWIANAQPKEIEAAQQGARIAADNQIRGFRSIQKGSAVPEVEFNSDKMRALFGKQQSDELFRALNDERNIADTNNKLINNSQTAMRLKADTKVDLPVEKSIGLGAFLPAALEGITLGTTGLPTIGTSIGVAALAGRKLAYKSSLALAKRTNTAQTNLLTATGPDRQELIDALKKAVSPPKQSILQIGHNALRNVIAP